MMDTIGTKGKVIITGDIDLSKFSGDTGRTIAFATELRNQGYIVNISVPKPSHDNRMMDAIGIELSFSKIGFKNNSFIGMLRRRLCLVKMVMRNKKAGESLVIETSVMGGYFALLGSKGYLLDVHGAAHDEVNYAKMPLYVNRKIFRNFIYFLEKKGINKAEALVVVSNRMKDYIIKEFKTSNKIIEIVENGYFLNNVESVSKEDIEEMDGAVTFIGYFARWANIEKIIRVADQLKKDGNIKFHLVGDGPKDYVNELRTQVESLHLSNVIFHGRLPLTDAYRFIRRSQVLILPFPRSICTEVACPIKLLEYMAFGKPTVLDSFGDLSELMEREGAAIVCDPEDDQAFSDGIRKLIQDSNYRNSMAMNAKRLSESYSWGHLAKKFANVLEQVNERDRDQ